MSIKILQAFDRNWAEDWDCANVCANAVLQSVLHSFHYRSVQSPFERKVSALKRALEKTLTMHSFLERNNSRMLWNFEKKFFSMYDKEKKCFNLQNPMKLSVLTMFAFYAYTSLFLLYKRQFRHTLTHATFGYHIVVLRQGLSLEKKR